MLKRWVVRWLVSVLLSTPTFVSGDKVFVSNIYCTVSGQTYHSDEVDKSSFKREDLCTMIFSRSENNQIELHSTYHWVLINIPEGSKGFVAFWYRWGARNAYFSGVAYPIVDWGYVLRG